MPTVPRYGVAEVKSTVQPDFQQSNNNASAEDFGGAIGRGLSRVGQAFGMVAQEERDKAADTALIGFESETTNVETELLHDPQKGALAKRGQDAMGAAAPTLAEYDKREREAMARVPRYAQQRAKVLGAQRRVAMERTLGRHAFEESERFLDGQSEGLISAATNEVGLNFMDPGRIGAGLQNIKQATETRFRGASPEQQAEAVRTNQSRAVTMALQNFLLQGGPAIARAKVQEYGKFLTADHAQMLETRIQNEEQQLANHAETQAAKRETIAEHATSFVQDAASTGIPLTPDALFERSAQVQGTTQEKPFAAAVAQMREVAQVRDRPFVEQQQYIDQLDAQLQQGSADPKHDQSRLNTLRSALEASRTLAKESPVLFWERTGGAPVEPVNFQLGAAGIESALVGRFVLLGAARKRFGPDVSFNPWRPEEADALRTWIAQPDRTAAQKLEVLGAITKVAPDPQALRDSLSPLALSDRVTYLAGMEQYANHSGAMNGPVAPIILQGAKVLADKSVPMPTEAKFREAFDTDTGSAYPPGSQERADAYIRFKTVYAGLAEKIPAQRREQNEPGELDEQLRDLATNLATGGLIERNGAMVPKPFGMKDEKFLDRLNASIASTAVATGIPAETLSGLQVQRAAGHDGFYLLLNLGQFQLDPRTGKPLVLQVKP